MKLDKKLKILIIILLIILISIISFAGLYLKDKNRMVNVLKDYKFGMDLTGGRVVSIAVNTKNETIYYDKDGNVVESKVEGGSEKQVPINSKEELTKDNYINTKEVIEKRLNNFGIDEYLIRVDENTGKITVQLPEDNKTDFATQYIYSVGEFNIVGEKGEILLDNSNIKVAKVGYNTLEQGTVVYLNIEFNEDCIEKIKEISNTYVASSDEEGNDTSKKITMNLDGSPLVSTSFDQEISNGTISITVGNISTDNETINSYVEQASNLAILLNSGAFPLQYEPEQNRYIQSDIQERDLILVGLAVGFGILIAVLVLAFRYKKNGLLVGIANIGYIAILVILIRYTNVIITIEGLFGILISIILNYIFSIYLLKTTKGNDIKIVYNKTAIKMLFILIPAFVVGVTLCFVNWMPIYSFGQIIFWGIVTIFIYNTVLTRTLLIYSNETKNK